MKCVLANEMPTPPPGHRCGEDFRAGRWWWEDETMKECGLHVKKEATT